MLDRLKKEKIYAHETIRTLGELGHGPAIPYLVDLATTCLEEDKPDDTLLFCISALGNIAPRWNGLTNEEFDRIIDVFTKALNTGDIRLIDGVVRCYLPDVLKCKYELREPLKTKLLEALIKLLEFNGRIRENTIERLAQLGDKRAVPPLKKLLEQSKEAAPFKPILEWALKVLEQ